MWVRVGKTEWVNLNMAERMFITMQTIDKLAIVAMFSGDKAHVVETFSIAAEPQAVERLAELCGKLSKKK